MLLLDALAEEQITAAMRRGEFDDLPGQGEPLLLEDDSAVPEELRVAYRVLRNAGCLPPEQILRNEIHQVEELLRQAESGAEEQATRRRLCLLRTRLALEGRKVNLLVEQGAYREGLLRKLAGGKNTA